MLWGEILDLRDETAKTDDLISYGNWPDSNKINYISFNWLFEQFPRPRHSNFIIESVPNI